MIFLLLSFFDLTPHPKHRFKFQISSIVFQFSFLSSLGFALFVPPFTSHLSSDCFSLMSKANNSELSNNIHINGMA